MDDEYFCAKCHKKTRVPGEKYLTVLEKDYHPDCLICTQCNNVIKQLPSELTLGDDPNFPLICQPCKVQNKHKKVYGRVAKP